MPTVLCGGGGPKEKTVQSIKQWAFGAARGLVAVIKRMIVCNSLGIVSEVFVKGTA